MYVLTLNIDKKQSKAHYKLKKIIDKTHKSLYSKVKN
jgi:hypothetical protein